MRRGRMRRLIAGAAGIAVLAGVVLAPTPEVTEAVWIDAEYAGASLSAPELTAPEAGTCVVTTYLVVLVGLVFKDVTLTWSAPYPKSNIKLAATSGGTTHEVDPSLISVSGPSNGVYSYSATLDEGLLASLVGNLLGSTTTLSVTTTVPGSTWESPAHERQLYVGLLGLSPTCT